MTVNPIAATNVVGETEVLLTYPLVAGKSAVSMAITATDIVGLPVAVKSVTTFVEVSDLAVLLAAEKAARAADKALADKNLELAKAEAAAAISEEKAKTAEALRVAAEKAAAEKAASDKAMADEKAKTAEALRVATEKAAVEKAASDKALAALTAQVTALTKSVANIKKAYNAMAKKYKFKTIK
jgi:hypothetical protein